MIKLIRIPSSTRFSTIPRSGNNKLKETQSSERLINIAIKTAAVLSMTGLAAITYNSFFSSNSKSISEELESVKALKPLPKVDKLLTTDQVEELFSKNQTQFDAGLGGGDNSLITRVDLNSIASNPLSEDYHSIHKTDHGYLIGIFDGHGGPECGALVSKVLNSYIDRHLKKVSIVNHLLDKNKVKKAMTDAFLELDNDIVLGKIKADQTPNEKLDYGWGSTLISWMYPADRLQVKDILKGIRIAGSGSCAIVAYLQGDEVYIANTGDCRAVIGRNMGYNNTFDAVTLSLDQTAASPTEFSRMCEEHPGEDATIVVRGRVLGGLMPSRSFGDARYKWTHQVQTVLTPVLGRRIPPNLKTPPYVTAKPEVTYYKRDHSDKFLVLATDGLWDNISSKTSVKVMSEMLSSGSKITNYATALIKAAVSGYGHEGASVERMIHSLSIPSTHSRRYRDDITAQVVFFPSSGIEATSGAKEIEKSGAEVHFENQPRLYQWVGHFSNNPKKPNFQKSKL